MKSNKLRKKILKRTILVLTHWIKNDGSPRFNYGGWRRDLIDEITDIAVDEGIKTLKIAIKKKRAQVFSDFVVAMLDDLTPEQIRAVIDNLLNQNPEYRDNVKTKSIKIKSKILYERGCSHCSCMKCCNCGKVRSKNGE